jgi:hypothetical protein
MRGRVMSLIMLSGVGLAPFSLAIAGAIIDVGAATLAFAVGGGIIVAAALAGMASDVPRQMTDEVAA